MDATHKHNFHADAEQAATCVVIVYEDNLHFVLNVAFFFFFFFGGSRKITPSHASYNFISYSDIY